MFRWFGPRSPSSPRGGLPSFFPIRFSSPAPVGTPASMLVIKRTPIQVIVKIWGAGTVTLVLANLKTATQVATTPIVDIRGIWFSLMDDVGNSISRGGQTFMTLKSGSAQMQFDGWADIQQHDQDIVVSIGSAGGTIVLDLTKKGGYGDSQFNRNI